MPSQSAQGSFQIRLAPIGDDLPYRTSPSESSISPSPLAQTLQAGESILSRTICRSIYPTVCPHLPSLGDLRVRPWACKFSGHGGGTAFCRLGHKLRCPDVGDVLSVTVEYFSFHQITSSLADLHESCETPAVPWGEGMENANRNGAAGWFIVTWATSL